MGKNGISRFAQVLLRSRARRAGMAVSHFPEHANLASSRVCTVMLKVMINPVRDGLGVVIKEDQDFGFCRGCAGVSGRSLPLVFRHKNMVVRKCCRPLPSCLSWQPLGALPSRHGLCLFSSGSLGDWREAPRLSQRPCIYRRKLPVRGVDG